jgi:multidrug efflux pump subunit AcrA (membrane-fusion protein)
MLSRKAIRQILPLTIAAVMSASCASVEAVPASTINAVVADGTLSVKSAEETKPDYEYITAEKTSQSRYNNLNVAVNAPIRRDLFFERDNGRLTGIHVANGTRVKAGDVIAEIKFDQERLTADRNQLVFTIEQFEQSFARQDEQFQERLTVANETVTFAEEADLELAVLNLTELELSYEQFLFNNQQTRDDYDRRLTELDEQIAGEKLLAPFDGIIGYVANFWENTLVRNWNRIATVIDDQRIQFSIEASKEVLRYGTIVTIKDQNETVSFDAKVVSDPLAVFSTNINFRYMLEPVEPGIIRQLLGDGNVNLEMLQRLNLSAEVMATEVSDAFILPRNYVHSEDRKRYVNILEDDMLKKRYVVEGITFPEGVQIIDGLEAGQLVVLSP